MWLFNNAMRQKEIYSMLIYDNNNDNDNDNAASIITQITKVTKSISRVSSIYINHHSTFLSHRTDQLLNCYEYQVYHLWRQWF